MPSQKKKVRIVNKEKKAKKDEKKKSASDGISKARKTLEDGRQRVAQKRAKREELKNRMAAASEEEAKTMKMEIDTLEDQLEKDEKEVQDAEAEEARFKKEEADADNEDVHDEMEVDDENDPDQPLLSIETETETEAEIDPIDIVRKLMEGVRLNDPAEVTDILRDNLLRPKQKVTCYKDGFGKPAIVVDCEIPKWMIYRIRKDVLIPENCPDLMTWRRAGVFKDRKTRKKWSVDDILKIEGIAIEVPPGYDKNPEELVRLIPKLSATEKEELKKKKIPIPKQPDVQLLIEWKVGMTVDDGTGKLYERFTSWESRSGCRTLWKKHRVADDFLLDMATRRELGYRNAGGRHSSEVRSMSPIDIPRAGSTPGPDEEEEDTENEVTDSKEKEKEKRKKKEEEKKKREEEERKRREEEKKKKKKKGDEEEGKGAFDASDYKTASDEFEIRFRARKGIAANVELTPIQEGDLIEAFEHVWKKRQAARRESTL